MPDTTADDLRAAAAKLREHATAARAEMHAHPYWGGNPANFADGINNACGGEAGELAALFSPDVAEPLADLLEEHATQYELPACDDPTGVCNRCDWDPSILAALAVARAINGGES